MEFAFQPIVEELTSMLFSVAYIWLPIVLGMILWKTWVYYVQAYYITNNEWTLFEIKLPREITKSPKAMELALHTFHFTRDSDLIDRYWRGFVRQWTSLEIASFGGEIHFFIRVPAFFKKLAMSQLYAQYPDVEIVEVDDYTSEIPYGKPGNDWSIWGVEFKLEKEDAYPIKTYIDYGLAEDIKEEQKVDPITHLIEYLGTLGEGEQVWFQILIQGTRDRFKKPGTWFGKEDWKAQGRTLVEKLLKRDQKPKSGDDEKINFGTMAMSPGEREIVEAIERSISKLGFDVGIRAIYLARKDRFDFVNVAALLASVKQYNTLHLNGFKPTNGTSRDYPWQDPFKVVTNRAKRKMFDAYCKRSYFYPPYMRKPFVLNTEELATIYHFPGRVSETPTFSRIESKKSEPPTNLPT